MIKKEIKNNKKYIYLSYAISILTIIPLFIVNLNAENVSLKRFILIFMTLAILFLVSKFSKILFSMFIIYLNLSNILMGHIFIHWGYDGSITPRLDVAALSPRHETLEYLATYIDYRDILLFSYSIFTLLLLYKFLLHFKHSFKVVKFFALATTIALLIIISNYRNPLTSIEPFCIPNDFMKSMNYGSLAKDRKAYLKSLGDVTINNEKAIYDKVVVIQGEAANKHHMSIYDYQYNTTPFFTSLKSKDNFYIFNAIAPTNLTSYSVPIMHTKASVHDFKKAFIHSKSIVSDFRDQDYSTYWISNQGKGGMHDDSVTSMSHEANVNYFPNIHWKYSKYDGILLKYLSTIEEASSKEMYVIHLMGSHANYTDRYPKDMVLFRNASTIQEQYDNTIFYTDYIIKNIFQHFIHKFKNKKILFVYTSDHGEVVSENKAGHGMSSTSRDEYDVPFVIYSNIKNSRIDKLYELNLKKRFNLENLNYMIEYISGIRNDANISYSNDIFSMEPKNILDYNKLEYYKN